MPAALRQTLFQVQPVHGQLPHALQMGLAVGVPLAVGFAAGRVTWGLIAAFGAFMGTLASQFNGGTPSVRVGTILTTVLCVVAGAAFGSAMEHDRLLGAAALFAAALVAGRIHGAHPIVETVARFTGVGVAIGVGLRPSAWSFAAFYLAGAFVAAGASFAVSQLHSTGESDGAPGAIRSSVKDVLRGEVGSTKFAIVYAATVLVALFAASAIGVSRPYWAALTVFLVMRPQAGATLNFTAARTVGTLLGVLVAGIASHLAASEGPRALAAAAFAFSIPFARQANLTLGIGAITAAVMLLMDLLPTVAAGPGLFAARFYDTLVACALVLAGTWIVSRRGTRIAARRDPQPNESKEPR